MKNKILLGTLTVYKCYYENNDKDLNYKSKSDNSKLFQYKIKTSCLVNIICIYRLNVMPVLQLCVQQNLLYRQHSKTVIFLFIKVQYVVCEQVLYDRKHVSTINTFTKNMLHQSQRLFYNLQSIFFYKDAAFLSLKKPIVLDKFFHLNY